MKAYLLMLIAGLSMFASSAVTEATVHSVRKLFLVLVVSGELKKGMKLCLE